MREKILAIGVVTGLVACVLYLVRDWDLRQTLPFRGPEPVQEGPLGDNLTNRIDVFSCGWYGEGETVKSGIEVRALLAATGEAMAAPRACLENIAAKLISPAGDPRWDA